MSTQTAQGILAEIRSRTTDYHKATEEVVNVMDPSLSLERYAHLLRLFYAFYSPIEKAAETQFTSEELARFDFESRRKTGLFLKDFKALGISADGLKTQPGLAAIQSYYELLGRFYVMEGATLGGQFISAHLQKKFGVTPEAGCAFFSSYGPDVPAMWKAYCAVLEENDAAPEQREEIIHSACYTFEKLNDWFRENN